MQSVPSYKVGLLISIAIATMYSMRIEASSRLPSIAIRQQTTASTNSSSHVLTDLTDTTVKKFSESITNNRNKCKSISKKRWTSFLSIAPIAITSIFPPLPSFARNSASNVRGGSSSRVHSQVQSAAIEQKSPTIIGEVSSMFFPVLPFFTVSMLYIMLFFGLFISFANLLTSISQSNFLGNLRSQITTVATVVKLQIGLDADWADERNVMQTLSELSSAPANKLSEVSVALLRRQLDWNSAAFDCRLYRRGSTAELDFHHHCLSEWAKLHSVPSKLLEKSQLGIVSATGLNKTQAVVSLIAVIRGRSDIYRGFTGLRFVDRLIDYYVFGGWHGSVLPDARDCLLRLAAEATVDQGANILNAEIIYTPSAYGKILSKNETLIAYPDLKKM